MHLSRLPSFTLALAVVLGLGPFAIDMYLASLPAITAEFAAPAGMTQLTLTGYLVMLGLGQLIAGPVTDAYGRRRLLLLGLGTFVAGSVLAALAPSLAVLVAARLTQGAGGAIAFVVANSSVRDRVSGDAATRVYAVLMAVGAVGPILAPALGGVVDQYLGWRWVFLCLALLGCAALSASLIGLPESLPPQRRTALMLVPTLRTYAHLITTGRFLLPLGALAGAFVVLFCYIGGASYVYQGGYGTDPATFGLVFGLTGLAAIIGALGAQLLAERVGTPRLARLGLAVMVLGSAAAVAVAATGHPVAWLAMAMGITMLGLSMAEPALMGLCMAAIQDNLGAASAVIGATQYVLGAIGAMVIAPLAVAGPVPWTVPMLAVSLLALALAGFGVRAASDTGRSGIDPARPAAEI